MGKMNFYLIFEKNHDMKYALPFFLILLMNVFLHGQKRQLHPCAAQKSTAFKSWEISWLFLSLDSKNTPEFKSLCCSSFGSISLMFFEKLCRIFSSLSKAELLCVFCSKVFKKASILDLKSPRLLSVGLFFNSARSILSCVLFCKAFCKRPSKRARKSFCTPSVFIASGEISFSTSFKALFVFGKMIFNSLFAKLFVRIIMGEV